MGVTVYDDGTRLSQDAAGSVIGFTDNTGATYAGPGAGGSYVVQQALGLLSFGARAYIDSDIARRNAQTANTQALTAAQIAAANARAATSNLMPLLLLAAGAFVLYKLVT